MENKLDIICNKLGGANTSLHRGRNRSHSGGDASKHGYTKVYYDKLNHLSDSPINLLEIGIFQGKGLAMWSDFFPKGNIYGMDISVKEFNLSKPNLIEKYNAFSNNNIKEIFEGDSTIFHKSFLDILPKLDIIIDDGLHRAKPQYDTFLQFFPKLISGGYYVIEDVLFSHYESLISLINNSNLINKVFSIESFKSPEIKVKNHYLIIIKKK